MLWLCTMAYDWSSQESKNTHHILTHYYEIILLERENVIPGCITRTCRVTVRLLPPVAPLKHSSSVPGIGNYKHTDTKPCYYM